MSKPTLISLFAGIGGLDLAAHWAGFETVRFVEKEPFCQKVLAKHWPNVPIDDDVFTSHPPHADVLCGGFPCQPFSVAGEQEGEEDERFLLPEMLRIVEEVKPYAVLFENVPGFTSLNDGSAFKFLLGCVAEMGFDGFEWGRVSAADIGAPHKRERWFGVAYVVNPSKLVPSDLRKSYERKLQQPVDHATNQRPDREPIYIEELAYTISNGNGISGNGRIDGNEKRHSSQIEQGWDDQQSRIVSYGGAMGNATSAGLGRSHGSKSTLSERTRPNNGRQAQPRIRGTINGLPGRLDFAGFPARPGEPQHVYEPPRTAPSTKETNARIKALGNAVVPQVAYPIFQALAEWFAEMESERAL